MKPISYKQSRKNSARRGRKAKVRRARTRGGRGGSKPVFGLGRIHLEIGDRIGAMSFGGIGVMRRLVSRLGLVREIDRRLDLLKRHLPYRESDHVLNIAYSILCGITRLEDLNGLRNNVPYLDALDAEMIPSTTAAGDFMRRFEQEDVVELMEALGAVRPQLWKGRGRELLGPVAYVDVDGTVAPTQGEKKAGMDMSYKTSWIDLPCLEGVGYAGGRATSLERRAIIEEGRPWPSTGHMWGWTFIRTRWWRPLHGRVGKIRSIGGCSRIGVPRSSA